MVEFAYFDTSAVVKIYDPQECYSDQVRSLTKGYKVCSSVIVYVETISAICRKIRDKTIMKEEAEKLISSFKSDYLNILRVEIKPEVLNEAERFLLNYPLKASDAIHLASASLLIKELALSIPFITADRRQIAAAEAEGFFTIALKAES